MTSAPTHMAAMTVPDFAVLRLRWRIVLADVSRMLLRMLGSRICSIVIILISAFECWRWFIWASFGKE